MKKSIIFFFIRLKPNETFNEETNTGIIQIMENSDKKKILVGVGEEPTGLSGT